MKEDSSTVICAARKEALPTMCARRSTEDLRSHIGTAQQFLTNVRMEIKSSFLVYFPYELQLDEMIEHVF